MSQYQTFEDAIKTYLDNYAVGDPEFAQKLASPKKSIEECVKFIKGEIFDKYIKGQEHQNTAVATPSRDECFGLAVHYYDEENIEIKPLPAGVSARPSAPAPEFTEEEKQKMRADAEKRMQERYDEEALKKIEEREKARKKAEAEKKKAAREQAEADRKASGEMSLFDMMGI